MIRELKKSAIENIEKYGTDCWIAIKVIKQIKERGYVAEVHKETNSKVYLKVYIDNFTSIEEVPKLEKLDCKGFANMLVDNVLLKKKLSLMTENSMIEKEELNKKEQNQFIDKLFDEISNLCEKANRKDYEPTEHEREVFGRIVTIVNNMNKWF